MHGPAGDTLLAGGKDECVEQAEAIHLGFQPIVEEGFKARHLGIHHHDVGGYSGAAQGHSLVGNCHGQIVHSTVLQGFGHFHSPGSVGIGFDHAHHLRVGMQAGTVAVQVLNQRVQVHFECGLVNLVAQLVGDAVEAKGTGALDENHL